MKDTFFSQLEDPRVEKRCDHKLSDILFIALCTLICNGEDFYDMEEFGHQRENWLREHLELPNGIPSHDTFNRTLQLLSPQALSDCLKEEGELLLSKIKGSHISLDGKKLRGVSPKSKGNNGLYVLSAWVNDQGFCLGQHLVEDKENEITVIPELLEDINIEGAMVSIDAIGCQKKIAETIIEEKGDYLLSVKGNQPKLFEQVSALFSTQKEISSHEQFNKGHGRYEERKCSIINLNDSQLTEGGFSLWKDINTLIMIESVRESEAKVEESTRYYISSSKEKSAEYFNKLVREHWGIENKLHWFLDVVFSEDASRARTGNAPLNLNILRKLALQRVKKMPEKNSMQKKRYRASLNNEYLRKIVGF